MISPTKILVISYVHWPPKCFHKTSVTCTYTELYTEPGYSFSQVKQQRMYIMYVAYWYSSVNFYHKPDNYDAWLRNFQYKSSS